MSASIRCSRASRTGATPFPTSSAISNGRRATRAPAFDLRGQVKKGDAIYNGVFNLLVIQGAKDWVNGMVPQPDELDDHHIVPKSWGAKHLGGNATPS